MPTGRVKWFNEIKGYGFISTGEGRDIYVHYSAIEGDGYRTLSENEEVEFEIGECQNGLRALNLVKKEPV